ncbi:MAG TPA: hypothetical protein VMH40_03245 [Myxococcaceae bacterium]|nr:hypothetical protein [Myxococcaceae bacterium]
MATTDGSFRAFEPGVGARYATMILGAWFFMSGLIWHHAVAVGSLDWILGLLVIALSVMALRQPRLHWGIAGLGAWILVQSALLPHLREGTVWNERVTGALVLILGLVGGGQLPEHDT